MSKFSFPSPSFVQTFKVTTKKPENHISTEIINKKQGRSSTKIYISLMVNYMGNLMMVILVTIWHVSSYFGKSLEIQVLAMITWSAIMKNIIDDKLPLDLLVCNDDDGETAFDLWHA